MDHHLTSKTVAASIEPSLEAQASEHLPLLVCWKWIPCDVKGVRVMNLPEDSEHLESLGLSSQPTAILLRPQGEEFARLEGSALQAHRVQNLVSLHAQEPSILADAELRPSRSSSDLVRLYLTQRRLTATIVAWKNLAREGTSETVCSLARQVADLALEMLRPDEAVPLLEHVRSFSSDEVQKIEAWSRLIWCHLTLGNTAAAAELTQESSRPSFRMEG